tara:strand:+ start:5503 stop:5664 length:162 start_codon:yes stop_codon:yes gene_type:complete
MDKDIKEIIEDIFPMGEVETISEMLEVIQSGIDEGKKSKRISSLREMIDKATK